MEYSDGRVGFDRGRGNRAPRSFVAFGNIGQFPLTWLSGFMKYVIQLKLNLLSQMDKWLKDHCKKKSRIEDHSFTEYKLLLSYTMSL